MKNQDRIQPYAQNPRYWQTSPWNPGNNVNYTYEQTNFAAKYPEHAYRDVQPFFYSIQGM